MTTSTTALTCQQVANELVQLVKNQEFEKAIKTLYSQDILSIEAMNPHGGPVEMRGLEATLNKSKEFITVNEIHSIKVGEPICTEHEFALRMTCDVTNKNLGQRFVMDEIAVYSVEDGKIVREQFFYDTRMGCEC